MDISSGILRGGNWLKPRYIVWLMAGIVALVVVLTARIIFPRVFGGPEVNLVVNPSFEDWQAGVPSSWQLNGGNVVRSTDAFSGKFAAQLKAATASGTTQGTPKVTPAAISQGIIGLTADGVYKVSVRAKGGSGEVSLLYSYNSMVNGQKVSSQKTGRADILPSQSYQEVNFEVKLPAGLSSIVGTLGLKTTSQVDLFVDDVSVVKEVALLPQLTHNVCQNNACQAVVGGGVSECQVSADCGGAGGQVRKKFNSQAAANSWQVFTNGAYNYTISYPPEFKVEKRGKVGQVEDLVAFNYVAGGKSITVVKVEIHSKAAPSQGVSVSRGKDGNGNEVVVYTQPYGSGKSVVLLGTVYPTVGGGFQYDTVLDQMSATLKVK